MDLIEGHKAVIMLDDDHKEELRIPVLLKETIILLREAVKDAAGQILVINSLGERKYKQIM